jgi:hypothetical protein
MPDTKITALTALTAADPANDMFPVVDVSDTTMAASGTTKRISINNILACSPSATLASATITGDLTVHTSTLKVDSANNRVGVGTASPTYPLQVAGRISYSTGIGEGADLTVSSSGVSLQFGLGSSWTQQVWYLNGVEAARLNQTANFVLKGGTAAANGVGVTFPATQVASSDANCLDDYEEGTWTIGLTFGGGSTGITTATNTGRYTKIGRQVTVSGNLSLSNKGSSTGIAEIQGLPFTIANSNEAYSAANVRFNGVSFADIPISIGAIGSTKILLQEITKAGVVTDITDADFTNTSSCIISFTYTV